MGTLKLHSNVQLFNTTVISTLAIDGCTVTFGTVRRDLEAAAPTSTLPAVPNATAHPSTASLLLLLVCVS